MEPEITPQKLNNLVKDISNFVTKFFNKASKSLVRLLRLTFDESIRIIQQEYLPLRKWNQTFKNQQNYAQASSALIPSNDFFYK